MMAESRLQRGEKEIDMVNVAILKKSGEGRKKDKTVAKGEHRPRKALFYFVFKEREKL